MAPTVPLTQKIIDRLRREAVVLMPLALAVYSVWPDNVPVTSYKVWAPIVVGALLRQFFTSPSHEKDAAVVRAFNVGRSIGLSTKHLDEVPEPGPGDLEPGEPGDGRAPFRPIQ